MENDRELAACEKWQEALNELYQVLMPHLGRKEIRERVRRYLMGLLSQTERKNGWQLAEAVYEAGPQGMQRLLNAAQWDEEGVQATLSQYIVEHIGEADGILIVDETGFLKKGMKSAGVARQYSGTAGRIENQQ